mgnify:CR=1 FL=1
MSHIHQILTKKEKNYCEYFGIFGTLLSATCLIQHLIFAIPNWLTYPMIPVYILSTIAFILLILQKPAALILLIITAAATAVIEFVYITHAAFSLVVLLLFLYSLIVVVLFYTESIPAKLKQKLAAEKAEADEWAGKI